MTDEGKKHANTVEQVELEAIMRLESGRAVLYRMIESTGYFYDTYDDNPYSHARRAGERRVGIRWVNELKNCNKTLFDTMMKENTNG